MKNKNKIKIINFYGFSMYPFLKPKDRLITRIIHPEELQIGDIVISRGKGEKYIAHRLVKKVNNGAGVLKGDSTLSPDCESINLLENVRIVTALIRGNRIIQLAEGLYSKLRRVYAFLSIMNLTPGAVKLRVKHFLGKLHFSIPYYRQEVEHNFIIDVLKNKFPVMPPEFSFNRLERLACREGVHGHLFLHLTQRNIEKYTCSSLEKAYNFSTAMNMKRMSVLKEFEQALDEIKIEVMILQGASLLDNYYKDIGLRPMGDIDLMVRPDDRKTFGKLLLQKGYKRGKQRDHIYIKDGISIDVHVHALNIDRIASRRFLFIKGMDPVWQNCVPWRNGFKWIKRPDDLDNIILLSLHMMKHSFEKLIWLVDVMILVQNRDDAFWTSLRKKADYYGAGKALDYVLFLRHRLFDVTPAVTSGFYSISHRLTRIERSLLIAKTEGKSFEGLGALLGIFCINGAGRRASFIFETVFPKRTILEEESGSLHAGNRIRLYLHRLCKAVKAAYVRFFALTIVLLRDILSCSSRD